jgi:glycosyltransferase involved in cell wall biosynthesis
MSNDPLVAPPFFSVILCTFNRAHLVKRAIESVLKQTFTDWQLIIVDDGSTDHTDEIVRKYVERDPRIVYTYAQNQGPGLARNRGIRLSSGEYITFIDSDDEYHPTHLQSRFEILSSRPEIDLLHGGLDIVGDPFVADKNDITQKIHLSECFAGGTFFIKRNLIQRLGGFNDRVYGDDTDFAERAVADGANIVKTDLKTYRYYRDQPDSLCNIARSSGEAGILEYRNITSSPTSHAS